MGKNNSVKESSKQIILLFILVTAITMEGFCAINDSNNDSYPKTLEFSNEQKLNKKTVEKDKIDLKTKETNQPEVYDLLHNKIIRVERHLQQTKEEIDKRFNFQMQCNEEAINSVNTSISGASYALTIIGIGITVIGIIIGLLAIGLGIYIAKQVRNVTHIVKQSKKIRDSHLKIRNEVQELNENIKNNMAKLYEDLKREETKALVERLTQVPEDILNLSYNLVSRDIPKELFAQIKDSYKSISDSTRTQDCKIQYRILFFQHFTDLSIFDDELQNEMENDYKVLMDACFKNDIKKTSEDFIKAIIKKGNIISFSDKIKKYFAALKQSKFKSFSEIHEHIYKILSIKENKFDLYSILQSDAQLKEVAEIYGRYLLSDYRDASENTELENNILNEITQKNEKKQEN